MASTALARPSGIPRLRTRTVFKHVVLTAVALHPALLGRAVRNSLLTGLIALLLSAFWWVWELGAILRTAQLPQGAILAASIDPKQGRIALLGENATLFVLAADSLACSETVYLGHKMGAILVPPAAVLDQLLFIESPTDDASLIHVLATDAKTSR